MWKKGVIFLILMLLIIALISLGGCFPKKQFTLTVLKEGQGDITPAEGNHSYQQNTLIELIAEPSVGWLFSHWEGEVTEKLNSTTSILLDDDKTVKAYFIEGSLPVEEIVKSITESTTWESNTIYVINNNISVTGAILTIEPGAIIKFGIGRHMVIKSDGVLIAQSNSFQPIIFTSIRDDEHGGDTNEDGDFTSPAAGDWHYLKVEGTAKIEHCKFLYGGGSNIDCTLWLEGTSTVKNSVFADNLGSNLGALYAPSEATIQDNIFFNNVKPLRLNSNLSLDDSNTFHNPDNPEEKNQFQGIFVESKVSSNDIIWEATEVPFVLRENLTIGSNHKLTLKEGVTIKLDNRYIVVNGGIEAKGKEGKPIIFTSYKDDTRGGDSNGDGAFSEPAPGDWHYIWIKGVAVFDYCEFYYGGGSNIDCTLRLEGTSTVNNSVFAYNLGNKNGTIDALSGAVITNNIFFENDVPLRLNPSLSLDNSNVFHNPLNPTQRNKYEGIFIYGSPVAKNVTWAETEIAFVIKSGPLTVKQGFILTLGDNVILKFDGHAFNHYCNIANYDGNGVFFTSFKDDSKGGDSNGDGNFSMPEIGDWLGVRNYLETPWEWEDWDNIHYAANKG